MQVIVENTEGKWWAIIETPAERERQECRTQDEAVAYANGVCDGWNLAARALDKAQWFHATPATPLPSDL